MLALREHSEVCLSFKYHMYGASVDTLTVGTQRNDSADIEYLYHVSYNQGDRWFLYQRTLVHFEGYIWFTTSRGEDIDSDIALDDIYVTGGPCEDSCKYRQM